MIAQGEYPNIDACVIEGEKKNQGIGKCNTRQNFILLIKKSIYNHLNTILIENKSKV